MMASNSVLLWGLFDTAIMTAKCFKMNNLRVFGMDYNSEHLGFRSNKIQSIITPDPNKNEKAWLDFVLEWLSESGKVFVLIPTSDEFVYLAAKYKDRLSKFTISLLPDFQNVSDLLERSKQFDSAVMSGLHVPEYRRGPFTEKDLVDLDLKFPVALKPENSPEWKKAFNNKGFVIKDHGVLKEKIELVNSAGVQYLVQEIIPGDNDLNFEVNSLYLPDGRIIQHTIQKIRQYPDRFGTATCIKSVNNPIIEENASQLVKHLGLFGFTNIEFKLNPNDSNYYYIETNPRVWLQVNFSERLGINFPVLYYDYLSKGDCNATVSGQINGKWVDFLPDLYYFIKYKNAKKIGAIEFFRSWQPIISTGLFSLTDPKPFMAGLHILKKIKKLLEIN